MQRQAEIESGASTRKAATAGQVLGADEVSDDDAKRLCREVVEYVQVRSIERE